MGTGAKGTGAVGGRPGGLAGGRSGGLVGGRLTSPAPTHQYRRTTKQPEVAAGGEAPVDAEEGSRCESGTVAPL